MSIVERIKDAELREMLAGWSQRDAVIYSCLRAYDSLGTEEALIRTIDKLCTDKERLREYAIDLANTYPFKLDG